ncbi:response regulator transcription factor [Streptomyces orinoci]|uniref:Response regulator transcription factor n=1 Tax=Streptomyces orinoci TaxID=67339 RepID=A0ABV3JUQ0_STRON|nr:response regulator transcription factor [Streptomyces orinoci]
MTDTQITVLVVDDHPMFRAGLRMALETAPDIRVVGEAGTSAEALTAAGQLRPRVIVMDLHLPDGSGIDATRALTAQIRPPGRPTGPLAEEPDAPRPDAACPAVLVMTMSEESDTALAALRAGARGYLLKEAGMAETINAVRVVADGGAFVGARMAELLITCLTTSPQPARESFPGLTERERDVLALLGRGHTNGRIAHDLGLKEKTVRNHVSNIFAKLQVSDRTTAAIRARDAGLAD